MTRLEVTHLNMGCHEDLQFSISLLLSVFLPSRIATVKVTKHQALCNVVFTFMLLIYTNSLNRQVLLLSSFIKSKTETLHKFIKVT